MSRSVRSRPGTNDAGALDVLDAAAQVFAEHGYRSTSLDDIADALESTKGKIYHYWRSKDTLYAAVLHRGLDRIIDAVSPVAADADLDSAERLNTMCRMHLSALMDDYHYQRALLHSLQEKPREDRRTAGARSMGDLNKRRRAYEDLFVAAIEEGQRSGAFTKSDPRIAARAVLGALNWVIVWYSPQGSGRTRAARETIADELAEFAVRGVRA